MSQDELIETPYGTLVTQAQPDDLAAAAGREYLRLDCDAHNPTLRAYYERAGFAQRGDVVLPHRVACRYEKRASAG